MVGQVASPLWRCAVAEMAAAVAAPAVAAAPAVTEATSISPAKKDSGKGCSNGREQTKWPPIAYSGGWGGGGRCQGLEGS